MPVTPGQPEQLIGDEERDNAIDALRAHMVAGRLSLDELNDRVAIVLLARTQSAIDAAFVDLPSDPDAIGGVSVWQAQHPDRRPMPTRPLRIAQRWMIILTPLLLLPLFLGWPLWWLLCVIWVAVFLVVNRSERATEKRQTQRELLR